MDYPGWFFGTQINQNETENVVLNCPSFRFAFWADLFFELLSGLPKIVSEYDQEIPQSQTADNPVALRGRAAQPSRDTRKTN